MRTSLLSLLKLATATVLLAILSLMTGCSDDTGHQGEQGEQAEPLKTTRELNLAWGTKIFCSSVFVSELAPEAAMDHSVYPAISIFPDALEIGEITEVTVDRVNKNVRLGIDDLEREASFYGDQGCVLSSNGPKDIYFEPVEITSTLPSGESEPWPNGEDTDNTSLPDGLDRETLDRIAETAFHPDAYSAAFVAVHRGKIIVEKYGAGANRDTLLVSWSMGKSLTAALLGVLFEQGEFSDLNAPAPIVEWQGPGDPRREIRIADLLRMSSGLEFSHISDPRDSWRFGHPDHMYVYSGAINVFDFVLSRPSEFPPATVGRYRNTDPLTLGAMIKRTVEARGQNYFTFPQSDLFDRIGIRKLVLEPDPYGNFVMTGFEYGRARDWARLGMLYLQDGEWEGERILPKDWAEFAATPAPAWSKPEYGGLFWLNNVSTWDLPEDAYYMAGGGGQYTIIVPSLELVVVRMGHFKGGVTAAESSANRPAGAEYLNRALGQLNEVLTKVVVSAK